MGTGPQRHRLLSFRFSLFSYHADFSPHGGKVAATALSRRGEEVEAAMSELLLGKQKVFFLRPNTDLVAIL